MLVINANEGAVVSQEKCIFSHVTERGSCIMGIRVLSPPLSLLDHKLHLELPCTDIGIILLQNKLEAEVMGSTLFRN